MSPLVTAVETAAAWLVQPCTECTCTRKAVRDGEVDPDCAGLHPVADGCLSHSFIAARIALADVGVNVPAGTRTWLRARVLDMLLDLREVVEDPQLVTGGLDPRRSPDNHLRAVA